MDRVDFTFKNGHTRIMAKRQAELLGKAGFGTYQTRDMSAQPMVTRPMVAQAATPPEVEAETTDGDGLDAMDREQLHALAKDRGVKVHHMAGADKVRAALRESA
ncbi:hypothetical protein [Variovorax paradoxus]|uniref:Uncharacterized protein n=1 Tax=Variovorax paradoxus TaxID=34073 RepID=A0A679JN91_VARPD|nr:hypothetical protein VVAX_04340 [Variovorax paradoxus]